MSFFLQHAATDVHHARELRRVLNGAFRDPRESEAVILSALLAIANVIRLMARIRSGDFDTSLPQLSLEKGNGSYQRRLASLMFAVTENRSKKKGEFQWRRKIAKRPDSRH
jgi:hypothetical protein